MARKDPKRDREDVLALIPFWAKSVVKTSTTETLVPLMLKNSPNRKYDSRYSDHIPIVEIKRRKKLIRRKMSRRFEIRAQQNSSSQVFMPSLNRLEKFSKNFFSQARKAYNSTVARIRMAET